MLLPWSEGLKQIAMDVSEKANALKNALSSAGISVLNESCFDTVSIDADLKILEKVLLKDKINIGYYKDSSTAVISIDETTSWSQIKKLCNSLSKACDVEINLNKCRL